MRHDGNREGRHTISHIWQPKLPFLFRKVSDQVQRRSMVPCLWQRFEKWPCRRTGCAIHLPDAPENPARQASHLPALRHGAGPLVASDEASPELADFTRRMWLSGAAGVPLVILTMGGLVKPSRCS